MTSTQCLEQVLWLDLHAFTGRTAAPAPRPAAVADRLFSISGNNSAGIDNVDVSYVSFVQNTLGVTVPATGVVSGGVKVIASAGAAPAMALMAGSSVLAMATSGADVFSSLINFGPDANGGLVALTLAGVTTPASVMADVI